MLLSRHGAAAEIVIPVATLATFVHVAWVSRRPVAAAEPR